MASVPSPAAASALLRCRLLRPPRPPRKRSGDSTPSASTSSSASASTTSSLCSYLSSFSMSLSLRPHGDRARAPRLALSLRLPRASWAGAAREDGGVGVGAGTRLLLLPGLALRISGGGDGGGGGGGCRGRCGGDVDSLLDEIAEVKRHVEEAELCGSAAAARAAWARADDVSGRFHAALRRAGPSERHRMELRVGPHIQQLRRRSAPGTAAAQPPRHDGS
ncbi:dachshund homolog 1-like [Lethenteron reissneri]|uniref:dachshund homolog 1-like n=1 Tax=Lethenteron reissneri TaxID=7753 RepID=UPI002AB7B190|nr:dachshund homolog 1-like [Lethenteron reissneri]